MLKSLSLVAVAGLASVSTAQLVQGSFEVPGTTSIFEGWTEYNNFIPNILANFPPDAPAGTILDGDVSVKIFGGFAFPFNTSGMFQRITGVQPGDRWRATLNVRHITGDAIAGDNFVFLSIVYVDSTFGNVVEESVRALDATTALDQWFERGVELVAPLGVDQVEINFGFVQPNFAPGAGYFDLATLERTSTGEAVAFVNGSFEEQPAFQRVFDGWREFGNSIGNVLRLNGAASNVPVFDGEWTGFIFGQFNGAPAGNDSGVSQAVPASEGQTWTASINALHRSNDALGAGNLFINSLQFLDASGTVLSETTEAALDSASPTDTWLPSSVSATAPAGTAAARMTLVFVQGPPATGAAGSEPAGAALFDGASLVEGDAGCPADFNGDTVPGDIFDLFDFLAALDGGLDFNGDTSPADIFDLFDFLAVLDAGCP